MTDSCVLTVALMSLVSLGCLDSTSGNGGEAPESGNTSGAGTGGDAAAPGNTSVVGEGTETLITCSWFEQDNCYKRTVDAVYACVDESQTGTFSADRMLCETSDGTSYEFASPPPVDFDDGGIWDFEILKDGVFCASVRELGANGDDGLVIETSLGEFRQTISGFDVVIECPDGERFGIDAFDAIECDLNQLPGFSFGGSTSSVSFNLLGSGDSGSLLSCSDP